MASPRPRRALGPAFARIGSTDLHTIGILSVSAPDDPGDSGRATPGA